MKYIFTLFSFFIFYKTPAQSRPWLYHFYNEIPDRHELLDSAMAANNYQVKTRVYIIYTKKGIPKKDQEITTLKYNDKGLLTYYEVKHTHKKKSEKYDYFYKDSFLIGYDYYKNEKLIKRYELSRNQLNKITDIIRKNAGNEIVSKQHNTYDEKFNKLIRSAIYDRKNREKTAIEYTYYDAKTMKQAREYRKGKLKKLWNYTCDPAGVKEEKVKEMKVCKNTNADEYGNRVETTRIVNPKGEIELSISTFDKNNEIINQQVFDDVKHKLRSEWHSTTANGNIEKVYIYYNKRGKQQYSSKAVFNNLKQLLSNEFISGIKRKHTVKNIFKYNDKGFMTHVESFDEKNRKFSESTQTFN